MEGLTNEMERVLSLAAGYNNQDSGGGGGGGAADQAEEKKPQNRGKKKGAGGGNGNDGGGGGGMLRTPADIYEHPTFYSFILDMPGVDAPNIKVKVENGVLHVTGKRKKMKQGEEGVKAMRLERRKARYMRKFTLPSNANHEDVKASYKDGVLTVSVFKNPTSELINL